MTGGKKRRSGLRRPRRVELTAEDVRLALEWAAAGPEPATTLAELMLEITTRHKVHRKSKPTKLIHIDDIIDCPARVIGVMQEEDLLTRSTILIDTATGEFLEIRSRGVRLFNTLSDRGMKYFAVAREAEDWARAQLSGRALRNDDSIR